jgi:hypothetical protein
LKSRLSRIESLAAEREQIQKIHNMSFRTSSITDEYQDGENSCCEFFGLVPFLQLAIQLETNHSPVTFINTNKKQQSFLKKTE